MKKLLFVLALGAFASCGSDTTAVTDAATDAVATVDSAATAAVATVDSAATAVVDSAKVAVDSAMAK